MPSDPDRANAEALAAEVKRLEAALEEARLEGEHLAHVAHEIRTLLNGVMGFAALLFETELSAEQRDYAKRIRGFSDALLGLLNGVLDFRKAEAGKLELEEADFDLRRIVEEVADLCSERASSKGLELVVDMPASVPDHARGDGPRVRQVLLNLVTNAIKFTERGEVVVRVEAASFDRVTGVTTARFAVVDTGVGISDEGQARLFQAFSQVDGGRAHGGSGLGLSLARRLVEAMGGAIGVQSVVGKGATFWFTLPLGRAVSATRREIPRVDLQGRRVLVLDASPTWRDVLREIVEALEIECTTTGTAQGAMALLHGAAAEGRPFELVIIDRNVGDEAAHLLIDASRARDGFVPGRVVLLAHPGREGKGALRGAHAADALSQLGAGGVQISKPVRRAHLHAALRTLMGSAVEQPRIGRLRGVRSRSGSDAHRLRARVSKRPPAPPPSTATPVTNGPRVLVVEDNEVNQRVAAVLFEKRGFRVDIADSGAAALEAIDATYDAVNDGRGYALVFMDLQMPKYDGYQTTTEVRRRELVRAGRFGEGMRRVPIVAMTADAGPGVRERCLAVGMDDYLTKPIVTAELDRVLKRLGPRAEGKEETPPAPSVALPRPPRSSATGLQAVSEEAINRLRALGDPSIVDEIVQLFTRDARARAVALREAATAVDLTRLARAAHALKGSAGNVGAIHLADLVGRIEARAKRGESPAREELDAVAFEVERAIDALSVLLA
jgi:CheY-like chemotaxis protein/nitrogen-specific signal transduction histidine kinase